MDDKKNNKNFLYRIMPVLRVKELFESSEIVFVKPEAWKDPFENFLSKVSFIDSDKKNHHIEYLDKVYGQCYSLGTETSLMWDAYSPNADGIRLTIVKDQLIDYLNSQNQYPTNNFRYGEVTYKRYKDFISKFKKDGELIKLYKDQNNKLLDYFFEKRNEYRDEREFRIMYDANNDIESHDRFLRIEIPVIELVDSIRFDPKMPEQECDELTAYFRNKGIDGRKINRSLLYKYEVKRKVQL